MYNIYYINIKATAGRRQHKGVIKLTYTYTPHGVCSRQIQIDIDENTDTINSVSFIGGCNGNLQGIAALVKGKKPEEVISVLKGIDCNFKGTSCPDQLARALEEVEEQL